MTILTLLWRFTIGGAWPAIKASPITRAMAKIGGLVLLVLTFGAWNRRQGEMGQKANEAAAKAKANEKAHERMNDADLGIGATDGERIERLHDFATKHGNRPAKGSGSGLR